MALFEGINKQTKISKTQSIATGAGLLYGIYFSMKRQKGFWGIAGYTLLFGLVGSIAGTLVNDLVNDK